MVIVTYIDKHLPELSNKKIAKYASDDKSDEKSQVSVHKLAGRGNPCIFIRNIKDVNSPHEVETITEYSH